MQKRERKLAAIMLTDIVGFSRKMGANEEAALRMLERHNTLLSAIIKDYQGQILKFMGDAILAEFNSVVEAVRCALAIQSELKRVNQTLPEEEKIVIRIGLHVGDVVVAGGDIFGDGVNIAARIQPLAEPGGINITSTVYNQIKNIPGINAVSLGERQLKNIKDPVEILKVPVDNDGALAGEDRRGFSRKTAALLAVAGLLAALGYSGWRHSRISSLPQNLPPVARNTSTGMETPRPAQELPPAAPLPPTAPPTKTSAAGPSKTIAPAKQPDAAEYARQAQTFLRDKNFADAVRTLDKAAALDPGNADIFLKRGEALLESGKLDEALKDMSHAIALRPENPLPYRHRANIQRTKGHTSKALADYEKACGMGDRYSCRMLSKLKGR
ncbi:MAG TPA: adenylate/guanylate cyclase domain-containing protein [Elusimicrobiota bacterium]|nr:adenylate/guanylate cyclase domain-containing protein [Elusimicrobiota bacterium]